MKLQPFPYMKEAKGPNAHFIILFLGMILMGWNLTLDTRGTLILKKNSSKIRLDWKQTVYIDNQANISFYVHTLYIEVNGTDRH